MVSHFVPPGHAKSGLRIGGPRASQESWPTLLTVVDIRAPRPPDRPFKLSDGNGVHLLVEPSEALLWRFRYKVFGIAQKLSLGSFPQMTLQQARRKRDEARSGRADGVGLVEAKRLQPSEAAFVAPLGASQN